MNKKHYIRAGILVALTLLMLTANLKPIQADAEPAATLTYPIVDTNQSNCYNNSSKVSAPAQGKAFYGQDAQYKGNQPKYRDNGDGTVTDLVTGLIWEQSPDRNGDGKINASDKKSYEDALAGASTCRTAGKSDWRLPTIKELYSLILFSGIDVSSNSSSGLVPFINTDYFDFAYGDTSAGERIIDSQWATSTHYVDGNLMFGVNFADGRIKGYWTNGPTGNGPTKTFYVIYVRGTTTYGTNKFVNNGDGTITDNATGLMWMKADNGKGLNWQSALAYAEDLTYAGHSDWRLPNAKELQSIVDYTRSPGTTNSAAIDPIFSSTRITNEDGQADYPFYWTSTTHVNQRGGESAAYISFGRALGYMNGQWMDVHGAGAQRSDPKTGDPADYPYGFGPQGDARRIYNYVRCVRDTNVTSVSTDLTSVKTITGADSVEAGSMLTMKCLVKNAGTEKSATSDVAFYLSTRKKVASNSILLGTAALKALSPGKKTWIRLRAAIPVSAKNRHRYIVSAVDEANVNGDQNTTDNLSWCKVAVLK